MEARERIINAIRRVKPDRVPMDLISLFSPVLMDILRQKTGSDSIADYYKMDYRLLSFKARNKVVEENSKYIPKEISNGIWKEDEVVFIPSGKYHLGRYTHPVAYFESSEQVVEYPWPDMREKFRHEHLERKVEELHRKGLAVMGNAKETCFEMCGLQRGLEKLLLDMMINKEFARALFDHQIEMRIFKAQRFVEAGVDILALGDDVGTQKGLIMSPSMWREWIKPRLAKVIKAARDIKKDILVYFHSDGNIEEIIPDLIEIGIDVLNPIQPEAMEPAKLKEKWGDRVAFWGTLSVQKTFPFGSPEDVEAEVAERIETVGRSGGLVIGPSHVLGPEVSWENIIAFFEADLGYR